VSTVRSCWECVTYSNLDTICLFFIYCIWSHSYLLPIKKGKVPPYSFASVWPRADHSVQAVSPQMTCTKLYCLVTEAHRCEQFVQGCHAAADSENRTHEYKLNALPLSHCTTCQFTWWLKLTTMSNCGITRVNSLNIQWLLNHQKWTIIQESRITSNEGIKPLI